MGKKCMSVREDHERFQKFQAATRRQNFEFLDAEAR